MNGTELAVLTEVENRLALIETPAEAAEVADVAAAAVALAKRSGASVAIINRAVRLKVNAERKAGEMLAGMELVKNQWDAGNGVLPALSDLGITKIQSSRWQALAAIEKAKWDEISERAGELCSADFYRESKRRKRENGYQAAEVADGIETDFDRLLDGRKFGTIYVDPPWQYQNQGTRAATGNHYETMTVEELRSMPVGELAAEAAHLHLWTTNAFLFECPKILEAWGFEYKSTFVWVKPQMGIGNYWRNSHEILITAIRGGLTALSRSEMSWLECRRGKHSAKPEAVRHAIERLSPGPYLELFGRRAVAGWVVFGNQVERELV